MGTPEECFIHTHVHIYDKSDCNKYSMTGIISIRHTQGMAVSKITKGRSSGVSSIKHLPLITS